MKLPEPGGAARRLDRPRAGGAAALRRHRGRRPPRSHRAEHPGRGARRPAGAAARRGADPLAGNQALGTSVARHQKTTPPLTGGSPVTMTEATGSAHGAGEPARRRTLRRTPRAPYTVPQPPAAIDAAHLAQHRHRALEPQGPAWPAGPRTPSSRPPCAGFRWKSATPTAPSWARPRRTRADGTRLTRS